MDPELRATIRLAAITGCFILVMFIGWLVFF
jgi:hypothetical protein